MARKMGWKVAYWMLMTAFLTAAALNLLQVRAGFFTSHLADLTVPALLYVVTRGLATPDRPRDFVKRAIGRTPERAAILLFLASAATEVSQIRWPDGFFRGRYDPWDIVAFGAGLLVCYGIDKMGTVRLKTSA